MSEMRAEDILAHRLDLALPPDSTSVPPTTSDPLVNMAARFARISVTDPSEAAFARMEAVVLAAFDRQYQQRQQSHRWVTRAARWAVAASIVFAILTAGLVPASAGSLPGEPLYTVKLLAERVEMALATSPESTALVHLNHAERRAKETLGLLDRNQFDQTLLANAFYELRSAEQLAPPALTASNAYQWQQQQVGALIQFAVLRAEEGGFEVPPIFDALPTPEPPVVLATQNVTPTPSSTASYTPSPTATATPSLTASYTPTPTATVTPSSTASYTPSPTASPTLRPTASRTSTPTETWTPRFTATRTPSLHGTPTPVIDDEPDTATDCPGNSCNSAGVPGGQINPDAPPGQSGGRDDNPPDPPGQGDPGGGQDNNPGQDNSGNNGGGSSQGQPPVDSGGNSGNGQGNSGNNGNNGNGGGNGGGNGQGN